MNATNVYLTHDAYRINSNLNLEYNSPYETLSSVRNSRHTQIIHRHIQNLQDE